MAQTLDPLVIDLVEWVAAAPRPYAEVMAAWRTACPRLTVWEDALDLGFVERVTIGGQAKVAATRLGLQALRQRGVC